MAKSKKPQKVISPVDDSDSDVIKDESTEQEAAEQLEPTPVVVNPSNKSQPKIVRADKPARKKMPVWGWVVIGLVLVAGASVGGYIFWSQPSNQPTNTPANENSAPIPVARKIDGIIVAADQANPRLNAVMIENINESRPPSGLDKASVVYEALAEGGITRFLAVFIATESVGEIGPVRSARSYYIDWASEYKPLYVHAGGSPQALKTLWSGKSNLYDFNQFYHGGYFWRDKNRYAPHNLYTSSTKLVEAWKDALKSPAMPNFTPWTFADDPSIDLRPEVVKDATIDFSSFNYKVGYAYDRGTNTYKRSVGGKLHVTRDGAQITAKNIVVQYTAASLIPNNGGRLQMTTIGQGKLVVFRNGEAVTGTWKKTSAAARTQLLDDNGQPITLTRGNTWIEIVPPGRAVTY